MFFDAGGSNFGDATQFFATRTKGRNDVTGAGSGELPRDDRFFCQKWQGWERFEQIKTCPERPIVVSKCFEDGVATFFLEMTA